MQLGVELSEFDWTGGPTAMGRVVTDVARTADDAGFALVGIGDHLWQGPHAGGPEAPLLECFTTLGAMAAVTRRCTIAPVVAAVHFRHPSLLAKMVTSLDVLSGGRAMLGIGAGWYPDEALEMGLDFPPTSERFERLEEAVQVCLRMWQGEQGEPTPFEGRHYQVRRTLNLPQVLSRPRPPIMIGGGGERKTLRLVARYADACNLFPSPDLADKLDVLRRHCDDEGRDYDTIEKTVVMPFTLEPGGEGAPELLAFFENLSGLGITTVIGLLPGPEPLRQVELVGEHVLPAARQIGALVA